MSTFILFTFYHFMLFSVPKGDGNNPKGQQVKVDCTPDSTTFHHRTTCRDEQPFTQIVIVMGDLYQIYMIIPRQKNYPDRALTTSPSNILHYTQPYSTFLCLETRLKNSLVISIQFLWLAMEAIAGTCSCTDAKRQFIMCDQQQLNGRNLWQTLPHFQHRLCCEKTVRQGPVSPMKSSVSDVYTIFQTICL